MKKQNTFLIIVAFILLLTLVSAVRFESNIFRYGEIDATGNLITTNTPVTGVSIFGVICNDASCSTSQGILGNGEFNISSDNTILNYSTTLQSPFGYGIYFYKKGYIPYEVSADWAGTDSNDPVGPFTDYLTKQRDCQTTLTTPIVTINENNASITVSTSSPINNSGPLSGTPSQISQYYSVDIVLTASINGTTQTKTLNVPFSSSKSTQFNFTLPAGIHSLNVTANTNNDLCVNTIKTTKISSLTITANNSTNSTNGTNTTTSLPTISILSPLNTTYNSTTIPLSISAVNATSIIYSLDSGANITYLLPINLNLSNGQHNILAYAINSQGSANTSTTFVINTSSNSNNNSTNSTNITYGIPFIFIYSPINNTTYNTTSILLNISSPNATSISYTLNNVPFIYTSPVFLPNLTNGSYNLVVQASNPNFTRFSSINFNINTTTGGNGGNGGGGGGNGGGGNGGGGSGNGNSGTKKINNFPDLTPENGTTTYYQDEETPIIPAKKKSNISLNWIISSSLLLLILLICLILYILFSRKK